MEKGRDLLELLRQIVKQWPKEPPVDVVAAGKVLRPYLAEGFDDRDLLNCVQSVRRIELNEHTEDSGTIIFYDADGSLQRAMFELSASREWKLLSLTFQCPVCFGEGINCGEACTICGGSGWGAD